MRVTKRVEDYIREQVKAKVTLKYEAEKAESKRIIGIKNDIESRAVEAAKQAAMAVFVEAKKYGDIFELDEKAIQESYLSCYRPIGIKDFCYINSVHKWESRCSAEVNKIVGDIIVTLELGGNKTDLDRMLSEI